MHFGTIARYRIKPGRFESLRARMERFEDSPPDGWLYSTVFQSTSDPNEVWMTTVFESEEAYRRNADSPDMDKQYQTMLEDLEGPPQWHDGNVISEAMKKAPA
jgi:quinol monooxygenase YgiN